MRAVNSKGTPACPRGSLSGAQPNDQSGILISISHDETIRKRMKRREVPGGIRYITFSCNRRLPLLTNPKICELFLEALSEARAKMLLQVFAWVIMPEHLHLLLCPHDQFPLDGVLHSVKVSVAKQVVNRWRKLDAKILPRLTASDGRVRFWQPGGGFDRNVRNDVELSREVQYIHRNPVERGLVERPQDWRWSSVRWWMGECEGEFECDELPGFWKDWKGYM